MTLNNLWNELVFGMEANIGLNYMLKGFGSPVFILRVFSPTSHPELSPLHLRFVSVVPSRVVDDIKHWLAFIALDILCCSLNIIRAVVISHHTELTTGMWTWIIAMVLLMCSEHQVGQREVCRCALQHWWATNCLQGNTVLAVRCTARSSESYVQRCCDKSEFYWPSLAGIYYAVYCVYNTFWFILALETVFVIAVKVGLTIEWHSS